MQTKISLAIIAAAILVAGGWVWYERTHLPTDTAPLQEEFDWSFTDLGVSATTSVPETQVSLTVAGVQVPLGSYEGDCFAVAGSAADLLPNELSGAICEWQGKGQEVGVFQQGTGLALMQGTVVGTNTASLSRTNFVTIKKQP
jgi:hypothetical protein